VAGELLKRGEVARVARTELAIASASLVESDGVDDLFEVLWVLGPERNAPTPNRRSNIDDLPLSLIQYGSSEKFCDTTSDDESTIHWVFTTNDVAVFFGGAIHFGISLGTLSGLTSQRFRFPS
jgi:hypothetical protein